MVKNIELIGIQSNKIDRKETAIIKSIIDAHAQNQSEEAMFADKIIAVKLRMNKYLQSPLESELIEVGTFLNEILQVYKIKKNKFAKYIDLSEPNFHALLEGRRKINNIIAKN